MCCATGSACTCVRCEEFTLTAMLSVVGPKAAGPAPPRPSRPGSPAAPSACAPELIRFGLLGPVVMRRGGALVPVRAPMLRSLLAALLLNANRVVAVEDLIDILWGEQPP